MSKISGDSPGGFIHWQDESEHTAPLQPRDLRLDSVRCVRRVHKHDDE